MVKNCDLGLENAARGLRPPSRQITYMYVKYSLLLNYSSNSPFQGGVTADQERETRAVYQPKRC